MDAAPPVDFERVVSIFTHRHTRHLLTRQASSLARICRERASGFIVNELPAARVVLDVALQALLGPPPAEQTSAERLHTLLPAVCEYVRLFGKPLYKFTAFAELEHRDEIVATLRVLGECLHAPQCPRELMQAVAECVGDFISHTKHPQMGSEAPAAAEDLHFELVAQSAIIGDLLAGLRRFLAEAASSPAQTMSTAFDFAGAQPEQPSPGSDSAGAEAEHVASPRQPHQVPRVPLDEVPRGPAAAPVPAPLSSRTPRARRIEGEPAQLAWGEMMTARSDVSVASSTMAGVDLRNSVFSATIEVFANLSYSVPCAEQLAAGFLQLAPVYMELGFATRIVPHVVETLWNVVESVPGAVVHLGTEAFITSAHMQLSAILAKGHRQLDRELRNDVLVLLNLIAEHKPSLVFFGRTECLRTLLLYSTFTELDLGSRMPPLKAFTQSTDETDLEMKQLMWNLITTLADDQMCLGQIVQADFLRAISMYIDLDSQMAPSVRRWLPSQLRQLQKHVLSIIGRLSPRMPERFERLHMQDMLLAFAQHCVPCVREIEPDMFAHTGEIPSARHLPSQSTASLRSTQRLTSPRALTPSRQQQQKKQQKHPRPPNLLTADLPRQSPRNLRLSTQPAEDESITIQLPRRSAPSSARRELGTAQSLDSVGARLGGSAVMALRSARTLANDERGTREERLLLQHACLSSLTLFLSSLEEQKGIHSAPLSPEIMVFLLDVYQDPSRPLPVRADAASLIAHFCSDAKDISDATEHRRLLRKAGGAAFFVDGLLSYRPSAATHLSSIKEDESRFLVATVDCVWKAIVPDPKSRSMFIVSDGVDALLALLTVCPPFARKQLLSCVCDLLHFSRKAVRAFHEWRGFVPEAFQSTPASPPPSPRGALDSVTVMTMRSPTRSAMGTGLVKPGELEKVGSLGTAMTVLLRLWDWASAPSSLGDDGEIMPLAHDGPSEPSSSRAGSAPIQLRASLTPVDVNSLERPEAMKYYGSSHRRRSEALRQAYGTASEQFEENLRRAVRDSIEAIINGPVSDVRDNPDLPLEDKAKLASIRARGCDRLEQAWQDVLEHLEQQNLQPTAEDAAVISENLLESRRLSDQLHYVSTSARSIQARKLEYEATQDVMAATVGSSDAAWPDSPDADAGGKPKRKTGRAGLLALKARQEHKQNKNRMLAQSLDQNATLERTLTAEQLASIRGQSRASSAQASLDAALRDPSYDMLDTVST